MKCFVQVKKLTATSRFKNERGMAMVETLPILIIFIVLFSYGLGLFGFVHTAIMNSIAARNYAFETFGQRSDLGLHRDKKDENAGSYLENISIGNRFHAISVDQEGLDSSLDRADIYATPRNIAFGRRAPTSAASEQDHNTKIYEIPYRNRKGGVEASPAWVMVGYGICMDLQCGDR